MKYVTGLLALGALAGGAFAAPAAVKGDVVLDFRSGIRGNVEQCGCASGNYGGVLRWSSYIESERKKNPNLITVLAGGMRGGAGSGADNNTEIVWDFVGRMKYDAVALAPEDLADIEKLPAAVKSAVVAANLTSTEGEPAARPVVFKTVTTPSKAKVRVALIGITAPTHMAPASGFGSAKPVPKVADAASALTASVPLARKNADIVVVLFTGPRETARALAQAVPGIDLIVAGGEGTVDSNADKAGDTLIVLNGDRGRFGTQIGLSLDARNKVVASQIRNVPLDESFKEDPALQKVVQAHRKRLTPAGSTPVAAATH